MRCASDSIAPFAGASQCQPCAYATQTMLRNRTACVPCPLLWSATLVTYAAGGGCTAVCASGAYRVASPMLAGGCKVFAVAQL